MVTSESVNHEINLVVKKVIDESFREIDWAQEIRTLLEEGENLQDYLTDIIETILDDMLYDLTTTLQEFIKDNVTLTASIFGLQCPIEIDY